MFTGSTATKNTLLIAFIILKFLLQYVLLSTDYDLHRDEYLHLDQAHHLAWGYQSVPPFTSWISYVIFHLGNSIFWVKFFPALYGALTILLVWKATETLNGDLFALILGATCILFSAILRLNTLYQPNSFDVLSWTCLYFVFLKYCKTENAQWLYVGAIVFGIGFLNKYNIVFLFISLVPAILCTNQRKIFANKELYFATLLGFLIIFPNLLWQYRNHWPVFHHLKELSETQLVNVNTLDFLKTQILFFIGGFFVIIAAIIALAFYVPFQKYRGFLWAFFITLAVFVYFKAKDYYAIGLYPIYIAFGSVYISELLHSPRLKFLKVLAIFIPIALFIPILQVAFPNKSPEYIQKHSSNYEKLGLLRWEDGENHALPQDFADMLGWRELAAKVDSIYLTMPNKNQTLILCDNYGQAGAINYYTKLNIKAVSFNADYIDWFDLSKKYTNLIRIKEANETEAELKETSPFFENYRIAGSITNSYAREFGTSIFAFTGAKLDINQRIEQGIIEKKNEATVVE